MAVNIIWSLTNGGEPLTSVVDHGNSSNGASTADTTIFLRHDGDNEITDAALYVRQYSGTYSGSFTPSADISEMLSWADAVTESGFGGFLVNFNALGSFATGWPLYNDKSPAAGGFVHRTGIGDSEGNAVTIPTVAGAGVSSAGVIATGLTPDVSFAVRGQVPSDEDTIGVRQWDQVLRFSYTS